MTYTKSLALIIVLGAASLFTNPVFSQEKEQSFGVSVFGSYQSLPANSQAMSKTQKNVAAVFPGWAASTDKLNGLFTDIYGKPVALDGHTNKDKAQSCMANKLSNLGVIAAEWKCVGDISAPKADYVNYAQTISGHPVVFSKLSFRFAKSGMLARVQMKNYGRPSAKSPVITKEDALKAAMKGLEGATIADASIKEQWSWFPVPGAGGYKLNPAWQFAINGRVTGGIPLKLTGYVDGITGVLLYRDNEVRSTGFDLTVKGVVYKDGLTNPATTEPLRDLLLEVGSSSLYTDASGNYSDPLMLLPLTTGVPLVGRWSYVVDSATGLIPSFSTLVATSSVYTYPVAAPSSSRHINAYYHTTRIHNFMKEFFPSFTWLDTSFQTNVDLSSGTCNAFCTGWSINFFAAGGGCGSFAEIGDIVYHEYGHAINAGFYAYISGSGMMNGALHEGYADTWAMSITHDPVLGRAAFGGVGFIRRYDVTPQVYPVDLQATGWADPHKNGQIIAGSWWDVGVALGSVDSMARLFTDVFYDCADGPTGTEGTIFQSILVSALMADDNDANLSNGTPHYAQIISAFARHGIYIYGDATLTHTELTDQKPSAPIAVTASLDLTNPFFFYDLTLYYRVNNAGPWHAVFMANTGFNYTGIIPAQPLATTIAYYFAVHDSLNTPTAYFPVTCNSSMPSTQTTIPYQFGIGIKAIDSNDFESPSPDYNIGGNPGDDATFGQWFREFPAGGLESDHTTGAGMCLECQSGTGGLHGTSSVISPVFDISSYTNPIVSYYRWFSNEKGFANFKTDPWIVKIENVATSTWQTVENTYQGDDNWRRRIFPVSAYLAGTVGQMRLKFFASDSVLSDYYANGQSDMVAAVDDIYIYDKGLPNGVATVPHERSKIYPNPANDCIYVALPAGAAGTMSLWNLDGKKISESKTTASTAVNSISTKNLTPGTYNLLLDTGGSIEMKKIVVVH